jgi:cytoskeletal protein RodZ
MKTAGALLQAKRLEKALTIEEIAKRIKIRPEYLEAIEKNDYSHLPSVTAAQGFLRNYARILYLNPDTILAMFRRDFTQGKSGQIIPRGLVSPLGSGPKIVSVNTIFIGIALIAFFSFLSFQVYQWASLPKLQLLQPENGELYVSKVTIKGTTDKDAVISVNNQKVIVDQSGGFTLDLIFAEGTHSVVVQAENRAGKIRLLERTFQVTK